LNYDIIYLNFKMLKGLDMLQKIKKSVAVVFAHIIKLDDRDIESSYPLFAKLMGEDFALGDDEAKELLLEALNSDSDIDSDIEIIAQALKGDILSKYHLFEQLNHIIYSDEFSDSDYEFFEYLKEKLI